MGPKRTEDEILEAARQRSQQVPEGRIYAPPAIEMPAGIQSGWADEEEDGDDLDRIWLRWPPTEFLTVRVTSAEPVNYLGHWVPLMQAYRRCTAPRCHWCAGASSQPGAGPALASEQRRRHLLSVQLLGGVQRIWEFSPKVAKRLREFTGYVAPEKGAASRERELRGLVLVLSKEGRRRNGETCCALPTELIDWPALPEPLDVPGYLAQTWRRAAIKDGKAGPLDASGGAV